LKLVGDAESREDALRVRHIRVGHNHFGQGDLLQLRAQLGGGFEILRHIYVMRKFQKALWIDSIFEHQAAQRRAVLTPIARLQCVRALWRHCIFLLQI